MITNIINRIVVQKYHFTFIGLLLLFFGCDGDPEMDDANVTNSTNSTNVDINYSGNFYTDKGQLYYTLTLTGSSSSSTGNTMHWKGTCTIQSATGMKPNFNISIPYYSNAPDGSKFKHTFQDNGGKNKLICYTESGNLLFTPSPSNVFLEGYVIK